MGQEDPDRSLRLEGIVNRLLQRHDAQIRQVGDLGLLNGVTVLPPVGQLVETALDTMIQAVAGQGLGVMVNFEVDNMPGTVMIGVNFAGRHPNIEADVDNPDTALGKLAESVRAMGGNLTIDHDDPDADFPEVLSWLELKVEANVPYNTTRE